MNRFFVLVVSVALLSGIAGAFQGDFNRNQLTPKRRSAYLTLASASVFAVGGVGYGNQISQEELALYDLLDKPQSVAALRRLVQSGTYEGALYGLLGLRIKDHEEFNRAVEVLKARKDRPKWETTGPFEQFRPDDDTVTTARSCFIINEQRDKVVAAIRSGWYDQLLRPLYRPSR